MMALVPLLLGAQLVMVSDRPPALNIEPSCVAAAASGVDGRSKQACMDEENTAKNSLGDRWRQFSSAQQSRCGDLVTMGGPPSYVELLTCLEMADQAKKLPETDTLRPAGMKPASN